MSYEELRGYQGARGVLLEKEKGSFIKRKKLYENGGESL